MQWSERSPAARSRLTSLERIYFEPRAVSVAVAHFILVRSMPRLPALFAVFLWLCGCASETERYAENLKRAQIHKTVHLPAAQVDQIIRTVNRESMFPIVYITRENLPNSDQVVVYTDFSHSPQRYMVYRLQKTNGGDWRIVWHGEGMAIYTWKT